MKLSRIQKLYLSNLLTGLVFWYGIEKLFMRSIGINAVGVGIVTAIFLIFSLIFDIPAGILADKWSRKGALALSALALAVCSVVMGRSHSLLVYGIGELFYGAYVVSTSGTYSAIIYDSLQEEGRADQYSKIAGRAYALFLAGAGVGNILSGFIASHYGFRATYFITVMSCLLNVLLIATIHEPQFHKAEKKEQVLKQLHQVSIAISKIKLVRVLVIVLTAMAISELFKSEFGQLYMFRYFTQPQVIGFLWACFAFSWSLGSLVAHRFRARLNTLIFCSVLPFIAMSFIDNWFSLVLFMFQAIAAAALFNQAGTRIQEATPSEVRASILSIVSTLGRAISIPASFILGWLFRDYNALWALRFVAVVSGLTLVYWLWASRNIPKAHVPIVTEEEI